MSKERIVESWSGWTVLPVLVVAAIACGYVIYTSFERGPTLRSGWQLGFGTLASLIWVALCFGFFTLQPNVSGVLLLFGAYRGTNRSCGFRWVNPLITVKKISLRAHNLNGEKLKVNDKRGNPIEIAAVVVWRVQDTAEACFDVEDYKEYVQVQSESALRHLATRYAYDTTENHDELTLRGSIDEVSHALQVELAERLGKAGVTVDEARLSHLAYASEIAGAMLRRQQAEAIVAARQRIVDGAVGMVQLALERLDTQNIIKLDEERKAAMVSNLLVVLCGDRDPSPVINTGTLYS